MGTSNLTEDGYFWQREAGLDRHQSLGNLISSAVFMADRLLEAIGSCFVGVGVLYWRCGGRLWIRYG